MPRNQKSAAKIKKRKPKARKTWKRNPVTRVIPNKKKYKRTRDKKKDTEDY